VSAWPQLSGGEGGFNAMDATNPLNWYISTGAGVSVNQCALGGACAAANFAATAAIGSAQTAGDAAAMDAPFLLDPGLQSNVIVGTCRVWRGPGSGGGLWSGSNLLSAMLDGVAEPECNGSNGVVRSLAAGGTVNGGGSAQHAGSQTIYAGLAGAEDGGGIKGGHLFSTTAGNTATSTTAWTDLWLSPVTNDPANNLSAGDAQFNPGLFDISSVTVDAHDATGATVYATVMGFGGNGISEPHVYRSTDGGGHWANISSNLPDAPANSVVVDPGNANTVYVALDTGVYSTTAVSTCATPTVNCWSVFGSGLPNAPVTQLAAATGTAAGGVVTGVLRAGTYGRGIWQVPLLTATLVQQAAPVMTLSATTLSFAAQQVQTLSAAQSVSISNTGNAALNISQIAMTGDFTETDNCVGTAVAAGAGCVVQVTFLPSATGARTGAMTLYANVSGGQGSVALSGTGLAPAAVTLNPVALAFPATLLGASSAAQNITVTNSGGVGTALTTPVLSGDFAVSNNTCGVTLAAVSACAIAITFTPSATGARSGGFAITDSAGTQSEALSGTGNAAATDTLSPAALSFAAQTVGSSSATQQVTLTNSGDVALTLITVSATGDFTAVNGCGSSLGAHSSCAISVTYVPRSTGAESGTLTVTDVTRSQTVTLSGTGLAPAGVSLTPVRLSFGSLGVGRVSGPQTVTLTNNGGSPLTVGTTAISGDYALASNSCPATLAANAACALVVEFAPTATGTRAGTLSVSDSAASSPQTVPLTGTGVDFSFVAEGSTTQTVSGNGGTGGYGILLTPASGVSGTVTVTCGGAPANTLCSVSPATADLSQAATLIQVNISTAVAHSRWWPVAAMLLPICLLTRRRVALLCCVLCVAAGGCGTGRLIPASTGSGSAPNPTPAGSYSVTVTAADGVSLAQHSVGLTLVVQ
jgi:hypothetical protein